jgi:predicted ArsR family transcriptional regulator
MSQQEIINLLEKRKELTTKEIAEILDLNVRVVLVNLTRLFKHMEIERVELSINDCKKRNLSGFELAGRNHYAWRLKGES